MLPQPVLHAKLLVLVLPARVLAPILSALLLLSCVSVLLSFYICGMSGVFTSFLNAPPVFWIALVAALLAFALRFVPAKDLVARKKVAVARMLVFLLAAAALVFVLLKNINPFVRSLIILLLVTGIGSSFYGIVKRMK